MKLNQLLLSFLSLIFIFENLNGQTSPAIQTREVILRAYAKGQQHMDISTYPGTLLLHGMSEYALLKGNEDFLPQVVEPLVKFGSGDIKAAGNFISYEAGGSGSAYLAWKGATDKLDKQVAAAAEKMMSQQKRTPDGLMTIPHLTHHMFIDVTFAVTPFLLYSGLKFNKPEQLDYAVFQTLESFRILKDEKTGLIHQGRGFQGEGKISDDNWSRGNGWGAFALAILVRDLPESHPKHREVIELAKQFFASVLKYQNKQGLWHQEMSDPTSYIETSGSGILLYSLGIMLEKGLLDKKYQKNLEKGLSAFLDYIGPDGSVSNTCIGCLCPGKGTKEDYKNRKWELNDYHAFGPVVLAYTQAAKMGITAVKPLHKLGYYVPADSTLTPKAYARPARGSDVAWENDRIAFRVYGPTVRDKVRSGVDVWAKSVDYPILDKWYKLMAEGKDYHTDRGEGCDFYHMGKLLGCGGLAVWIDGKPYASESYDSFNITKNEGDKIDGEAKFFRAIAYRELVYLYGGVPLFTEEITTVKNDLTRAPKQEILEQMAKDFADAAISLPSIEKVKDGKVSNIVASHYLAETYISLGQFDKAIEAATKVISDPNVALMKARYGKRLAVPNKDVFWDMFQRGNINRGGGNKEALWVCQMEEDVPGGALASTKKTINFLERFHVPAVWSLTDTKGKAGFVGAKSNDNLGGRGVSFLQPTALLDKDVWPANYVGDLRCNDNNFIKDAIYDNPASVDFGKSIRANPGVNWKSQSWRFYSWFIKATTPGDHPANMILSNGLLNGDAGGTQRDMYYLRLAESYLLRAEAYLAKGSKDLAAADINVVRARALTTNVAPADVTLDYILDERARELALEEQRSITLRRVGKYVERVKKYNPLTGASALPHHELWPIPLKDIEANINGNLEQNPGY